MTKRQKQKVFLECYRDRLCNDYYAKQMVNANAHQYGFSIKDEVLEGWYSEPWFVKQLNFARSDLDDKVEMKFLKEILTKGNKAFTIFYCKTKLRDRGYAEKVDENAVDVDEEARRFRQRLMELEASVPTVPPAEKPDAAPKTLH